MKNVLFVMALTAFGQSASAYVYQCSAVNQDADYLVTLHTQGATSSGTADLYKTTDGFYKQQAGETTFVKMMDGGPTMVTHVPPTRYPDGVNWRARENRVCYLMDEPTISFTIRANRHSEMTFVPRFIDNPLWRRPCERPNPMRVPVPLNCRLM
ncbi:MAG: hypothetical protein AB7N80_07620 [Bdellovibrionales bacterium]